MSQQTLWQRVKEQTEHALQCGALQKIPTEYECIEQNEIQFLIRVVSNLARKDETQKQQDKPTSDKKPNPFLPYDTNLFVENISETHVCLLNKFNVVDYHVLIVTRAFEQQETLLNLADFAATWSCLSQIDGLAFYNSGQAAGASQPHKHLQLVPLPLNPEGPQIPIEPALESAIFERSIGAVPHCPFKHAFIRFAQSDSDSEIAQTLLETYNTLMRSLDLVEPDSAQPLQPYNLLMTREWMLIVPRSQEKFNSISVNSIGFAGTILVRNQEQLQMVKDCGPMTVLQGVAVPMD